MLFNDVRGGAGSGQSYLWDIKAKTDLIIETMYIEFTTLTQLSTISIWTKEGTYRGYEKNKDAWTQIVTDLVWKTGTIRKELFIPIPMEQGATQALYVYSKGPAFIPYSFGKEQGSVTVENEDLSMHMGHVKSGNWNVGFNGVRSLRTKLVYRRCDETPQFPTQGPKTESPTPQGCVDDESFSKNRGGRNRTCAYIGDGNRPWRANKWCMKKKNGDWIYNICCKTCMKKKNGDRIYNIC